MIASALFALGLAAQSPGADADADLEGRWRLTLRLPIAQTAPVIGDLERTMEMEALVEVQRAEAGLVQKTRPCGLEILGGGFVARVEVPEGFADAISVPSSPVERRGERFATVLRDIHLGYAPRGGGRLAPTSPDDPAVTDADKDGHPGVTVNLKVLEFGQVQLYVVQHMDLRLVGEPAGPERWRGEVRVRTFEQNLLASQPSIPGLADDLTTRAGDGVFRLERVAPDATCATL